MSAVVYALVAEKKTKNFLRVLQASDLQKRRDPLWRNRFQGASTFTFWPKNVHIYGRYEVPLVVAEARRGDPLGPFGNGLQLVNRLRLLHNIEEK